MTEVPMPKLSMNMSEGLLIEWRVEDGATVEEGDVIAEIESEKSVSDIEAPDSGTISITVQAGETVPVGTTLAKISEKDRVTPDNESDSSTETSPSEPDSQPTPRQTQLEKDSQPTVRATPSARRAAREHGVSVEIVAESRGIARVAESDVEAYVSDPEDETKEPVEAAEPAHREPSEAVASASVQQHGRVRASPAARKAARERSIDIGTVDGTGPEGAIVLGDVESAAKQPTPTPPREPPKATGEAMASAPVRDRTELTGVRRTIADRLTKSWRNAPHVTVNREITVNRLQQVKQDLNAELDVAVSLNDLFLAALSETLEIHPDFNATLEDGEHIRYDRNDIAIAVDTDRGLISPVLWDVDGKSFTDIATARADLVEQTLEDELPPDRLEGGTFTVTNLGTMGVTSFTPIINPPQVAILGLSSIQEQPTQTENGDIEFNNVMTASLSFDHRAVDGADAARFLETFDKRLSNPLALVVS